MPPDVTCVASTLMQHPHLCLIHINKQRPQSHSHSLCSLHPIISFPFLIMSVLDYCFLEKVKRNGQETAKMGNEHSSCQIICHSSKIYSEGLRDSVELTPQVVEK